MQMRAYLPSLLLLFLALASPTPALAAPVEAAPACPSAPPTEIRSTPVLVTGMFFDVIGAAALVGGTSVIVASHDCGADELACSASGTIVDLGGIAVATGGAIFLAIGIPLTVVGAQSVPVAADPKVDPKVARSRGFAIAF
jgi:hypothetical protein